MGTIDDSRLKATSVGQKQILTPSGYADIIWCSSCHKNYTRGIFGGDGRTNIKFVCSDCIEKYGTLPGHKLIPGTETL